MVDFDEYEYLEKTVETAAGACNGDGGGKDEGKDGDLNRGKDGGHRSDRKRSRGDDDERDRDREKSRHRSSRYDRERDRHDRKSRDADDKDRRRDRDHKEKSRERENSRDVVRERDREFRKSRERRDKKDDPQITELEADPERDQRTVFAWQICLKAKEKDVYDFFSKAGKVRDVRLIMDRNSRRSKGVGYVEFYDVMSVPNAIAMTGQKLLGQPVMVKTSEAEKNQLHMANSAAAAGGLNCSYSTSARRLYVGNLHCNITEEQLRQVFEPFGNIELVQLPTDTDTGLCKGYGFVQYQRLEDARGAQMGLNNVLSLAGRVIKVSAVSDQQTGQELGITPNDLDDDEGGGLALNARSRALLMQKLDRSGTAANAMLAPPVPAAPVAPSIPQTYGADDPVGTASECLLLKNMFDPTTEEEPDFDLDIKEDVHEECSKHGTVKHIYVDKNSLGHVYVKFATVPSAISAQQALHKRWFAGKVIVATFMTVQNYENKFPDSRRG